MSNQLPCVKRIAVALTQIGLLVGGFGKTRGNCLNIPSVSCEGNTSNPLPHNKCPDLWFTHSSAFHLYLCVLVCMCGVLKFQVRSNHWSSSLCPAVAFLISCPLSKMEYLSNAAGFFMFSWSHVSTLSTYIPLFRGSGKHCIMGIWFYTGGSACLWFSSCLFFNVFSVKVASKAGDRGECCFEIHRSIL